MKHLLSGVAIVAALAIAAPASAQRTGPGAAPLARTSRFPEVPAPLRRSQFAAEPLSRGYAVSTAASRNGSRIAGDVIGDAACAPACTGDEGQNGGEGWGHPAQRQHSRAAQSRRTRSPAGRQLLHAVGATAARCYKGPPAASCAEKCSGNPSMCHVESLRT